MNSTKRSRRVIVLNQYAKPLAQGGATRHTELFRRLRGWEHLIIAGDLDHTTHGRYRTQDPHFRLVPVTVYEGNDHRRMLSALTYCLRALREALRGPRPDVVYASSPHLFGPVPAWLAARLRGAKFVLEIRDLWPQSIVDTGHLRAGSLVHRALCGLESWLYRRADRIVIVAAGWRSYFEQRGIESSRIEWVSNSAEPVDFDVRPELTPLRDRCAAHGRLIVYAGAHGPANGLDQLLDAAAELPEHTFALIGDGIEKPRLMERTRAEGLRNVRFVDSMSKQELAGILGGADIGVHVLADAAVFRLGLSPNKVYDYLAAGLPIVTNCPDDPHVIVMESGAGVAVGSDELAAGIRKLAGLDDATLREMGRQGREYIQRYRSRTVMAARLQRVLDDVVGAGGTAVPAEHSAAADLIGH